MRWHLGLTLLALLAIAGWFGPAATTGQDRTEERLSSLETRVADQADEISSLKRRVKALETAGKEERDQTEEAASGGNGITVSGTGVGVTDKFTLSAGRYKVTAEVQTAGFDGFSVFVYPPEGSEELLFNEIIDEAGTWTGSAVFDAPADGSYFVEVQNTSSTWTLTFESF